MLAVHFIQKFGGKLATRRVRGIFSRARMLLEDDSWPRNVRKLENVIERAVVLGTNDLIMPDGPTGIPARFPRHGAHR